MSSSIWKRTNSPFATLSTITKPVLKILLVRFSLDANEPSITDRLSPASVSWTLKLIRSDHGERGIDEIADSGPAL